MRMQGPWEATLTFSEDAKLKGARHNLRMQGYPWESCSSLLCGLTVLEDLEGHALSKGVGQAAGEGGASWSASSRTRATSPRNLPSYSQPG